MIIWTLWLEHKNFASIYTSAINTPENLCGGHKHRLPVMKDLEPESVIFYNQTKITEEGLEPT